MDVVVLLVVVNRPQRRFMVQYGVLVNVIGNQGVGVTEEQEVGAERKEAMGDCWQDPFWHPIDQVSRTRHWYVAQPHQCIPKQPHPISSSHLLTSPTRASEYMDKHVVALF